MRLKLFAHPLSSYCMKARIALGEKGLEFELKMLDPEHTDNFEQLRRLWPIAKFPLLQDGAAAIFEATSIIEYLETNHPGSGLRRLIPQDPSAALEVRHWDRVFDNYVMTPMTSLNLEARRGGTDPQRTSESRAMLDTVYRYLDARLRGRRWSCGENFSMADCAAAPSLLYADWVHPIVEGLVNLRTYRQRLLERASVAQAVDEARPYRHMIPTGAPDRD